MSDSLIRIIRDLNAGQVELRGDEFHIGYDIDPYWIIMEE